MLPKGYKFKNLSVVKFAQVIEAGKLGRLANTALAIQRRKDYNASPNYCLECSASILVPLNDMRARVFAETKQRKFCNRSCAARHNNYLSDSPRHKPKLRICSKCSSEYIKPYDNGTRCSVCRTIPGVSSLGSRTKGNSKVQEIRNHARMILFSKKARECAVCGYVLRVDCCHVRPIKSFADTALLLEINAPDNLIALCPNHHAEFDLGLLKLDSIGV
jgi:hypothetical protein